MTQDIAPITNPGVIASLLPSTARITYNGDVPMSPYTIPNVMMTLKKETLDLTDLLSCIFNNKTANINQQ